MPNRALAIAQRDGPQCGLTEIDRIADRDRLAEYPFYSATLGELHLRLGNPDTARDHFFAAMRLARNVAERRLLQRRIEECGSNRFVGVNGVATRLHA